jgi:hypothetical protein
MLLSVPRRATTVKLISKPAILFVIPLVLFAFTHLWNPIGFPAIHSDEGRYLTKAVNMIKGVSPTNPGNYYHPFFGQIVLAGMLGIVGYPDLAGPIENGKVQPIENLWLTPRILMGVGP